ncbi:MAG: thioredoxin [Sediminibacterium sp.]|jgi:thioredoxin 1|nr:thioredoxin [Bacteroidota bacterium]
MSAFNELINGKTPVLVDFTATWCGPCKMMSPILDQVAGEMGDAVKIIKVDVDKNPQAAAHFQVQGVPTLILFKEGKTLWRQSGVVQANQLSAIIQQFK